MSEMNVSDRFALGKNRIEVRAALDDCWRKDSAKRTEVSCTLQVHVVQVLNFQCRLGYRSYSVDTSPGTPPRN